MKGSFHFVRRITALKWQSMVCLLLALFLLYNPFLTAPRTAGGLEVRHPVSHRATVGASELQHFTNTISQELIDFDVPAVTPFLLPALSKRNFLRASSEAHTPQKFLCASLFFRPPPAS
jgi:hypothetical protein